RMRLTDRIQVFALQIFDQRDGEGRAIVELADDDGNRREAREPRRLPAPLAGDDLDAAAIGLARPRVLAGAPAGASVRPASPHDERLQDAWLANRVREVDEAFLRKRLPRLIPAGDQPVDRPIADGTRAALELVKRALAVPRRVECV